MEELGIVVETHHHEVATAGQAEIDMRFAPIVDMADQLMVYKYVCKNVAKNAGKVVTFMPKPLFGDNGSGMHTHQSLWKDGKPLFAGNEYAGLSKMCLYYIGGVLKHAKAIAAIIEPDHELVQAARAGLRSAGEPGLLEPQPLGVDPHSRCTRPSPKAKRIEVRFPDPTCNPYLAFAAMLMAGLDGIENKIDPGEPLDKNIYALSKAELAKVPTMPGSLERGAREPGRGPRVPAQGRRVQPGRDRGVDRVQARRRDRSDGAAPDAARVRALLRHVGTRPAPVCAGRARGRPRVRPASGVAARSERTRAKSISQARMPGASWPLATTYSA